MNCKTVSDFKNQKIKIRKHINVFFKKICFMIILKLNNLLFFINNFNINYIINNIYYFTSSFKLYFDMV